MRDLLDTSVLLAGVPGEVQSAGVSVATIAELQFGVLTAAGPQKERRSERLRRARAAFEALPIDLAIADQWGVLAAHTAARGRQPRRRAMDLLIAATAQVHGLTLVTLDEDLLWLSDVLEVRRA